MKVCIWGFFFFSFLKPSFCCCHSHLSRGFHILSCQFMTTGLFCSYTLGNFLDYKPNHILSVIEKQMRIEQIITLNTLKYFHLIVFFLGGNAEFSDWAPCLHWSWTTDNRAGRNAGVPPWQLDLTPHCKNKHTHMCSTHCAPLNCVLIKICIFRLS